MKNQTTCLLKKKAVKICMCKIHQKRSSFWHLHAKNTKIYYIWTMTLHNVLFVLPLLRCIYNTTVLESNWLGAMSASKEKKKRCSLAIFTLWATLLKLFDWICVPSEFKFIMTAITYLSLMVMHSEHRHALVFGIYFKKRNRLGSMWAYTVPI